MNRFTDWTEATASRFFARVEQSCETDAASLGIFRILWGLYVLLFVTPYVSWAGRVPAGFFLPAPLSLASLFNSFPSWTVLVTVELVVLTSVLAITLGWHTRVATLLFVVGHTFLYSFQYAFGKIDHEILLVATTACLGLSNWGASFALRPDRPLPAWMNRRALALAGIMIAFGMFTAGHEKAFRWLDFDPVTSGFLSWFYRGYMTLGRTFLAAPWVPQIPPLWFEVLDKAAVAFELLAAVALLIGPRAWRLWLLVACVFHLGNTVLLNIPFLVHVPVYLLFVRWPAILGSMLTRATSTWPSPAWLTAAGLAVALWATHTVLRLRGAGSRFLFIDDRALELPARLYAGLVLWLLSAGLLVCDLISRTRRQSIDGPPAVLAGLPAGPGGRS